VDVPAAPQSRASLGPSHWLQAPQQQQQPIDDHQPAAVDIDYEYIVQEIAASSGFNIADSLSEKGDFRLVAFVSSTLIGHSWVDDGAAELASLHEELLATMPLVEEANSISAELDKQVRCSIARNGNAGDCRSVFRRDFQVKFEIALIAPQLFGRERLRSEVFVKMKQLAIGGALFRSPIVERVRH